MAASTSLALPCSSKPISVLGPAPCAPGTARPGLGRTLSLSLSLSLSRTRTRTRTRALTLTRTRTRTVTLTLTLSLSLTLTPKVRRLYDEETNTLVYVSFASRLDKVDLP